MKFIPLSLDGAYLIEAEKLEDERGFFSRLFCAEQFSNQGLLSSFPQCNFSYNKTKGTLRGMHYQEPPFEEVKLVRCVAGSIYDCIIDLRPGSKTYLNWIGIELSASSLQLLYVPKGFAHGFLTLEKNSEVFYQVSTPYQPNAERGIRYDDPAFQVIWPSPPEKISRKDLSHSPFYKSTSL